MRRVQEFFTNLLYGDQPAGWDIVGEKDIITNLKHESFISYFNSHYIASNTVVVVAGSIDSGSIKIKTEEYFRHIRQADKISKLAVIEKQSEPQALVHFKATDQSHFLVGFRAYDMYNEKKYALDVLASILGGGMDSKLFQEVRDKRGLAYYVGAGADSYTDSGFLVCNAGVNNDKVDEALTVILNEISKIKKDGVTEEELKHAKDKTEGYLVLALENSMAVAQAYAVPVLFENKVLTPEEELAKIRAVTREDIAEVAQEIFKEDRLNLALIGPFKDAEPFKKLLTL